MKPRTFLNFMRDRVGSNWAICAKTKKNMARYNVCLSKGQFDRLEQEWIRETMTAMPGVMTAFRAAVKDCPEDFDEAGFHPLASTISQIRNIVSIVDKVPSNT